jgi:hypothetical protein
VTRRARANESAKVQAYKAAHVAAGLCKSCPAPVAIKPDGTPAKLCRRHLDEDSQRWIRRRGFSLALPFASTVRRTARRAGVGRCPFIGLRILVASERAA